MSRLLKSADECYQYIVRYFIQHGRVPSFQAIADGLGYASKRSVQLLIDNLREAGRIKDTKGKIELVFSPTEVGGERTVPIPVVGTASCGAFALAEQDIKEYVDVSTMIANPGSKYFILRAKGISMNLSGIDDGDLVLVRQQASANEGDRVVALVDDEATIKHFHLEKGLIVLRPNSTNKSIKAKILSEGLAIQGVVVATLPDTTAETYE